MHGATEKFARVCLALGELLRSQEGVWPVRTLVRLGDPQATVYVHMNEAPHKIRFQPLALLPVTIGRHSGRFVVVTN